MKKPKAAKKPGVNIDMTPLVDVILLLLTFFMLTATFKAAESEGVEVSLPESINVDTTKLPEIDVMTITLSPTGDIFLDVDNYLVREEVFGDKFAIGVWHPDSTSKSEIIETGKVGDVVLRRKPVLLDKDQFERTMNELRVALRNMTDGKSDFRIVVKGDRDGKYGAMEDLMAALKNSGNTRFALVTEIKHD
ncbi:MAG: biopolymer transporter ExbD [Ignavibacteriaceae bacterium]|jgi:Biopolymer transport protein|nr:MAG: hypothetical protein EDM69_06095 [Chlorobiota bacterium]KXK06450.1 MAG: biopolymer transport protein ExbD [Chlorobi bacterium OLB4]MBV6399038.1 hypothetical protein [Ignavibacteria bacterium]MCC6885256.1 biopolymer transporter ExbD [Ignavibacteriales bacterium]MCE7953342.1 hypothetical protein [Chlorobi bacterium CHB7]MDL1887241.1 hypothetical protein [Ignavibacteria bacterium CHB1]MEB2330116.1 biopolymer transporter ExbD [Ignavibacteriaceae bacterium]OQY78178.1 MAG: hypothetical pro